MTMITDPAVLANLAMWESVTVQNLNPLLSPADGASLWAAIEAFRASEDVAAFGTALRAIVAPLSPAILAVAHAALDALSLVVPAPPPSAPSAPSPAAAPAEE